MRTLKLFGLLLFVCIMCLDPFVGNAPCIADDRALTQQEQQLIRSQILPVIVAGEPASIVQSLQRILNRLSTEKIEAFDEVLVDANLPEVADLLLQSRTALTLNAVKTRQIPPTADETLLLAPKIASMCASVSMDARKSLKTLSAASVQSSFREFRELEKLHGVQNQRIENAIKLASFAGTLPTRGQKLKQAYAAGDLQTVDFEVIENQLEKQSLALGQAEVDLHVRRSAKVSQVLDKSQDSKERLLATIALITDAVFFQDLLPKDLLPKEILRNVFGKLDSKRQLQIDGSVLQAIPGGFEEVEQRDIWLAYYFDSGLSWWLRGRYGSGPLGGGLLKDPRAKGTKSILLQLDMPIDFPDLSTTDADEESLSTFCERRHHHNWQWENRRIALGDQPRNQFTNPEEYQVRWKKVFT
ncbi:MAG: hypothetical protein AAF483_12535 [Planctomycetota bacterium]